MDPRVKPAGDSCKSHSSPGLEEGPVAAVGLGAPGPGVVGPTVVVEAAGEEVKEARLRLGLRHALAGRLLRFDRGGLFRGVRCRFRRCDPCRCRRCFGSAPLPPPLRAPRAACCRCQSHCGGRCHCGHCRGWGHRHCRGRAGAAATAGVGAGGRRRRYFRGHFRRRCPRRWRCGGRRRPARCHGRRRHLGPGRQRGGRVLRNGGRRRLVLAQRGLDQRMKADGADGIYRQAAADHRQDG